MTAEQIGTPVFICGYPKSGTTLLLALLDRHPQLVVFPEETRFFKLVLGHPERCNPEYILRNSGAKSLGLGEFRYASGYRDYTGVDFEVFQNHLRNRWSSSDQSEPILFETLIEAYGRATEQLGKEYWVEKTPLNEYYLSKIASWWKDMVAIYIIRDPRDNFCSYRKLRQKRFDDLQRKENQETDRNEKNRVGKKKSTIQPPLSLDEFIAYWLASVREWENYSGNSSRTLILRYEDLVNQPRKTMAQICSLLGIKWDDNLMIPTRNGVYWSGNSVHGIEFTTISSKSVGRYKDLISAGEICYLEAWLNKTMNYYGYEPEQTGHNPGISFRSYLKSNTKISIKARMLWGYLRSNQKYREYHYA